MIIIFSIFALIQIYFSWRSFRGGIRYLNFFADQISQPLPDQQPFSTVIIPCKGIDHDLEKNLAAFLVQEYTSYEIIFVVDDESDASVEIIERLIASHSESCPATLIVATMATDSGQKVENLREAVMHIDKQTEILVFADSDARPMPDWLAHLTAPLADESIGAATGYRWFITDKGGIAGELRSAWNASIASALGADKKSNFCWGGSTAIRRSVFNDLDIRTRWKDTVSDDFTVTRILREAKMPIHFVPKALAVTIEDCSFKELIEFTNRQMKITRVYMRDLWILSFIGSGLFCTVMLSAVLILISRPESYFANASAILTMFIVSILSVGKAWLRLSAVRMVLPDHSIRLRRQLIPQLSLWLLAQPLFFINCFTALFSKKIRWRGVKYLLRTEKSTEIVTSDH